MARNAPRVNLTKARKSAQSFSECGVVTLSGFHLVFRIYALSVFFLGLVSDKINMTAAKGIKI